LFFTDKSVSVVPKGSTIPDFQDQQGPVSYEEHFDEVSSLFGDFLSETIADFSLTITWMYNGKYIANFRVCVEGEVVLGSNVNIGGRYGKV